MRASLSLIASSALFTLAAAGGDCPVKTFDPSDKGAKCENTWWEGSRGCALEAGGMSVV